MSPPAEMLMGLMYTDAAHVVLEKKERLEQGGNGRHEKGARGRTLTQTLATSISSFRFSHKREERHSKGGTLAEEEDADDEGGQGEEVVAGEVSEIDR